MLREHCLLQKQQRCVQHKRQASSGIVCYGGKEATSVRELYQGKGFGVQAAVPTSARRQSQSTRFSNEIAALQATEKALIKASQKQAAQRRNTETQRKTGFQSHTFKSGKGPDKARKAQTSVQSTPTGFGSPPSALKDLQLIPLPKIPDLEGKSVRSRWNPIHLAFLGDAVWELFMRNHFFNPPRKLTDYSDLVKTKVKAEAQALFFETLQAGPLLTEEEKVTLRWGLNAKVVAPKRFKASGAHILTYKKATALECLIGYLYITDNERLQQVVQYLLRI